MVFFFMAVLPEKGQEVLHTLQVDKEHLSQDGGLQLLFIAELGFVLDSALADDYAAGCDMLQVRVLTLRFLENSGLIVAVLKHVDSEELLIRYFSFEAEHLKDRNIILMKDWNK